MPRRWRSACIHRVPPWGHREAFARFAVDATHRPHLANAPQVRRGVGSSAKPPFRPVTAHRQTCASCKSPSLS